MVSADFGRTYPDALWEKTTLDTERDMDAWSDLRLGILPAGGADTLAGLVGQIYLNHARREDPEVEPLHLRHRRFLAALIVHATFSRFGEDLGPLKPEHNTVAVMLDKLPPDRVRDGVEHLYPILEEEEDQPLTVPRVLATIEWLWTVFEVPGDELPFSFYMDGSQQWPVMGFQAKFQIEGEGGPAAPSS